MFAMVAAVVALGGQLHGKNVALVPDKNAAAAALTKASSRVAAILALMGRFWGCIAQPSASCWVERASSEASPAGTPSGYKALLQVPRVTDDVDSLQMALQLHCAPNDHEKSLKSFM